MLTNLLALVTLAASANFTYKDLKNLVVDNHLQSIEAVVPRLPKELNATLMFDSRSAQGSTASSPRVILFNDDASMVVGFNGDNSLRGHSRFEIMTFEKDHFEVKTIRFDRGPAAVDENPNTCFGCHGFMKQDLHPVWDPGLIWRGAYGSHDDSFMDADAVEEGQAYTRYVSGAANHPVYKYFTPKMGRGDRSLIENRPNLRLGLLLMRQQVKRIARLIGDPRERLKQLCANENKDDDIASNVIGSLENFLPNVYGDGFAKDFIANEAPSLVQTFQAGRELDPIEWPMTFEKRTAAVFDGSFPFKDLMKAELAKRIPGLTLKFKSLTDSSLNLKTSAALLAIDQLGAPLANDVCSQL